MFVKPLHLVTDAGVGSLANERLVLGGVRGLFSPNCLTRARMLGSIKSWWILLDVDLSVGSR